MLGALVLPASVSAQTQVAPDQTGTGGGPRSTITAPYTNSLGVTKPPGGASLAPGEDQTSPMERRVRSQNNKIESSICSGC